MGEHVLVVDVLRDGEDEDFPVSFVLTDKEYRGITEGEFFIFPSRIREELREKYPGAWYNDECYELDGQVYVCAD